MDNVTFHRVLALALFLLAVDGRNLLISSILENKQAFADICTADKCKNGGVCQFGRTCSCQPMTTGDTCDKGDCSTTEPDCTGPGETCKYDERQQKSYCDCGIGRRYSKDKGECEDICPADKCKNGGVCLPDGRCSCPLMITGDTCDEADCRTTEPGCTGPGETCKYDKTQQKSYCDCGIGRRYSKDKDECEDACTVNPCKNGGTCKLFNGRPICVCKPWYFGDHCEEDLCSPNPCKNNGTCDLVEGKVKCSCQGPFTGERCEKESTSTAIYTTTGTPDSTTSTAIYITSVRTDPTVSVDYTSLPSSVSDHETSPSERFRTTWKTTLTPTARSIRETTIFFTNRNKWTTIENFSVTRDLCFRYNCMNRGICREVNYRPRCFCISPFSGEFCENDPCTNNPCLNGGTCDVSGFTYRCMCKETFTGDKCESSCSNVRYIVTLPIISLLIIAFSVLTFCLACSSRCMSKSKITVEYGGLHTVLPNMQRT